MTSIITTCLYVIFSLAIIFFMTKETNRRLAKGDSNEETVEIKPYAVTKCSMLIVGILVGLAGLCGYIVSNKVTSVIGIIEVGVCFIAVLGAAVIDLKLKIIPNFISFSLIIIRLIIFVCEIFFVNDALDYFVSSLIGCFLCIVMLAVANKVVNGGIGGGDIKLLAAIGFVCGLYVVFSLLLLSLIVCAVVSGVLLISKKKTKKDHIPFGPFIFIGFTIMCLFTLY